MFVYPWNAASEGAKELANALKVKRIRHENSKFKGGSHQTVINWGSSNLPPEVMKSNVINDPKAVSFCTNKLRFFQKVQEEGGQDIIPLWTTDPDVALDWISKSGAVCIRNVLQGHSGEGLVYIDGSNIKDFTRGAPLYTRYVKKRDEFRVHIFRGEVLDIQRKALSTERANEAAAKDEDINWKIRNLANGFVYVRQGFTTPDFVVQAARNVVDMVGLDFGAVDVVQNGNDRAYVLEVNCAPGLEGTSIENYANAFRNM